jgi:putative alpha-1,2-mannosidase
MGSFIAFNLLGLYPLPATKQFLISSPFFPRVTIRNSVYDTLTTIIAKGFDGYDGKNIYIKVCLVTTGSLQCLKIRLEYQNQQFAVELELLC